MTETEEDIILFQQAIRHNVDWLFLKAIRRTEAGGPGREMGVVTVAAQTFGGQAEVAAKTVRNRLVDYAGNPHCMVRTRGERGYRRLAYNPPFIEWFGARWAPIGVVNDPTNLNVNWVRNVLKIYHRLVEDAGGPPEQPQEV